jgi:heme O synthase-like polyprenyltransferase
MTRSQNRGSGKGHVPTGARFALGLVAGVFTALLTLVTSIIPAIAIGGLGVGVAVALYLRTRTDSTSVKRQ